MRLRFGTVIVVGCALVGGVLVLSDAVEAAPDQKVAPETLVKDLPGLVSERDGRPSDVFVPGFEGPPPVPGGGSRRG